MVTSNQGHHTNIGTQGKCPSPGPDNLTRDLAGISLGSALPVPRPKSLNWVTQRQRGRGEKMSKYDVYENFHFLLIPAANEFRGSPGKLKSGARLRLGHGPEDSKLRSKKTSNFSSTKTETQNTFVNSNGERLGGDNESLEDNKKRVEASGQMLMVDDRSIKDNKKRVESSGQRLRCEGCGVQASSSGKG